jgi:hypothetical protein
MCVQEPEIQFTIASTRAADVGVGVEMQDFYAPDFSAERPLAYAELDRQADRGLALPSIIRGLMGIRVAQCGDLPAAMRLVAVRDRQPIMTASLLFLDDGIQILTQDDDTGRRLVRISRTLPMAPALPDQRRVALHEAGHVVVEVLSGLPAPKAVRMTPEGGDVRWPSVPIHTLETAYAELRMVLAGRAAEEVFLGAPSSSAGVGPESDLAMATRLVLRIETEWGMGDGGLTWLPGMPLTLQSLPWLRAKVDQLLTAAQSQVRAIIATHRREVETLADALLDAREIEGEALQEWVGRFRSLTEASLANTSACDGIIPFKPG